MPGGGRKWGSSQYSGGAGGTGHTAGDNGATTLAEAGTVGSNITLAGGAPNTLDGVALAVDDVVLVKDQTDGAQNGVYTVSTLGSGANGTWTRAVGMATALELETLALVKVRLGSVNTGTEWVLLTAPPYTLGATSLVFTKFAPSGGGVGTMGFATAATTPNLGNVTLAGGAPSTLDGVALAVGDIVLVKNQTNAAQNGVYIVSTLGTGANGTWTRPSVLSTAGQLAALAMIKVRQGTINANTQWSITTAPPYTVGATNINITQATANGGPPAPSIALYRVIVWEKITAGIAGTTNLPFNTLTTSRHYEETGRTYDAVVIRVSTGNAGTSGHASLYEWDSSGAPGRLLWTSTNIVTTANNTTHSTLFSAGTWSAAGAAYRDSSNQFVCPQGLSIYKGWVHFVGNVVLASMLNSDQKSIAMLESNFNLASLTGFQQGSVSAVPLPDPMVPVVSTSTMPMLGLRFL